MDGGGAELVVWTGRRVPYSNHKSHYRLVFEEVHCAFHFSHASVASAVGDAAFLGVLYEVKKNYALCEDITNALCPFVSPSMTKCQRRNQSSVFLDFRYESSLQKFVKPP
jgi:hypothetical protein